jgi:phenylalanyl-tRNA synthetase beta chain
MRTSLWPGLIQAAGYNQARQQGRVRLFESGLRFIAAGDDIRQEPMLALLASGPAAPEQWGTEGRGVDFFDLKGDLLAVLGLAGAGDAFAFQPHPHPALHPGQSARILRDGAEVGWIGMLHPQLAARLDLTGNLFLAEIRLDAVAAGRLPAFRPLSRFPSIRRDLAVLVADPVPAQEVLDCVRKNAGEFLQDIWLFDVYNGEKIEPGTKSLALSLILQKSSGTLTDQEVDAVQNGVLQALQRDLKAQLRV